MRIVIHRRRPLSAAPRLARKPPGRPRAPGGGTGRGGRGGGGGAAVATQTTHVQRMSVQREVDLSGTLLSPDQAKISSEVAGIVREVPVQLGTEVRAGDVLVRLEPRELQLAARPRRERAAPGRSAARHRPQRQDKQPPPDEQIASVRQAMANRDDARARVRSRAEQLNGRGLLTKVDRDTAETRLKVTRSELPGGARQRAQPERRACRIAAPRTSSRRRSWTTR